MTERPKIYSRRKGTDPIPVDAVYVGRPTQWQNPYKMTGEESRDQVCDLFEEYAVAYASRYPNWLAPLKGKDLVCWCQCPSDEHPKRCHAEILRKLANEVMS